MEGGNKVRAIIILRSGSYQSQHCKIKVISDKTVKNLMKSSRSYVRTLTTTQQHPLRMAVEGEEGS